MAEAGNIQMAVLGGIMKTLEKHPFLVRRLLRPLANAPLLGRRLPVFARAYMGATAFEIHDVDMEKGRIGIGGVEEIMAGSKIIELLHTTLGEYVSEKEKNEALYRMGQKLCTWEVGQALEHGRWAPSSLTPLIMNSKILDQVQTDPVVADFFGQIVKTMSRLITDEGGWGHLDFDFSSMPFTVSLHNSQEARWLGPSKTPVCHFYAGIVAGYASTISNEPMKARETACKAMGAPCCVFTVERV